MRFNGSDVLRKILDNPTVFPLGNNIDEIARKVILTRMKAATSVADIATVWATLGADNFKMVSDGISDSDAKSIVGKIDKENKEAKTVGGPAQRILLVDLASGKIEPRAKLVKERVIKSAGKAPSSAAGKAIRATSTSAKRKAP